MQGKPQQQVLAACRDLKSAGLPSAAGHRPEMVIRLHFPKEPVPPPPPPHPWGLFVKTGLPYWERGLGTFAGLGEP